MIRGLVLILGAVGMLFFGQMNQALAGVRCEPYYTGWKGGYYTLKHRYYIDSNCKWHIQYYRYGTSK